jgi:AraC-like DNA-binding protein
LGSGPATVAPVALSDDEGMDQGQPGAGRTGGPVTDESVRVRPAHALRPFVAFYSGYRQAGMTPGRHRGLPSPFLTVIFTLDEPLHLAGHPDPRQAPGEYRTLIGGLHTAPALITHQGYQSGIQLALSPLGARTLLGLPAGELAHLDVEGPAVLGPVADEIGDRVRAERDWPGRFAVLDQMLTRLAGGRPAASGLSAEVGYSWRRLLAARGDCGVTELAAETGWSDRHLRARFREETGLSPKAAARVIRFDGARRRLLRQAASGAPQALADLAADCGYYDQAHLARDFRDLAGCPPSVWLTEEFRNVQA